MQTNEIKKLQDEVQKSSAIEALQEHLTMKKAMQQAAKPKTVAQQKAEILAVLAANAKHGVVEVKGLEAEANNPSEALHHSLNAVKDTAKPKTKKRSKVEAIAALVAKSKEKAISVAKVRPPEADSLANEARANEEAVENEDKTQEEHPVAKKHVHISFLSWLFR